MLKPGENSYVTVEEADEYITSRCRSKSKDRQRWDGLGQDEKETLLINACAELEVLPFRGRKMVPDQPLSFPRLPYQYGRANEGAPADVKAAQIELALWMSDEEKLSGRAQRAELRAQGVTSAGIGGLSESYDASAGGAQTALVCPKAKALLAKYLSGGYAMC